MKGHRYPDVEDAALPHLHMREGGYRKSEGIWEVTTPNGLHGRLGNHEVTEHEDGTITVSPSILVEYPPGKSWHGYLERGEWREV